MSEALETEALQAPTIREALTAAVEQVREPVEADTSLKETDNRQRDEQGRFAPKNTEAPTSDASPATTPEPQDAEPAIVRPPRPTSWKKEYEEHWNSIDPKLAEYINQREREYATGVSTYRQAAEQARNLQQAMEPFMPELQRHNIDPSQWIRNLGAAHQMLAQGSPQQKLQLFARLATDYGVDVRGLIDGNGQPMQPAYQSPSQPQITPQQIDQLVEQKIAAVRMMQDIEAFKADTTNHPHFETVRETMAGLLQSRLAQNLEDAYEAALCHPRHKELLQSLQESQRAAAEAEQQRKAAEAAKSARAKAVSVKGATPSMIPPAANSDKGRRELLQEAFGSVGSSRV
jgi:hypothetical protein